MSGLLLMLPIAVGIALVFLGFFLWSLRNGDYEDPEMIKYRMLMDDDSEADENVTASKESQPRNV